jgi:hypothetical protein
MTDQELLELAAKAAGYARIDFLSFEFDNRANVYDERDRHDNWNPLIDDGDAFKLAVKLNMSVSVDGEKNVVWVINRDKGRTGLTDFLGTDPCAATRRAIVRAAAEIGKEMK